MTDHDKKLTSWQKAALSRPEFSFVEKIQKQLPNSEIYLVGGAVRDILLDRKTKDYDFVVGKVDAKDLEKFLSREGEINLVGKSFGVFKFIPKGFHVGQNGFEAIDIALPRTEHADMSGGYRDFEIQSNKDLSIEEDLGRRDFTINALAWDLKNQKIIDCFGGLEDLENKIIKAIGDPAQRFQEDYTRMLRAIRFHCQLDFAIENNTLNVIHDKSDKITQISSERIHDEFVKIIMSEKAAEGIWLMQKIGLLAVLIPELEKGVGMSQNKAHIYDIFEHSVRALAVAAEKNYRLEVRLAALFHDIGKPVTKEGEGVDSTFYNHDQAGAKIVRAILRRLNFPNDTVKYVEHLVRYHMFYYALDTVSDAGVRRLLHRLGPDNIDDFIQVRICDRLGMGRPKGKPWKLIQLERRFKEVQLEPITPKMLKIDGTQLMELLQIKPGPRVGMILNALLGEVLDDPNKNEIEYLNKRSLELNQLPDEELKAMHPDVKFYDEERKRMLHE